MSNETKGNVGLATSTPTSTLTISGGANSIWSSGATWTEPEPEPELEMNWNKVKERLGKEKYEELIQEAIENWFNYNDRSISLLRHEGLLATKRENGLNDLLDKED
jgi:hypothetical protein